jgi:hypothetical protein
LNIIGHHYDPTPAALSTDFRRQKRRIVVRFAMVRTPQAPDAHTVFPVPPPLPGWARNEAPVTDTESDTGAAFQAGAALAALDCRARAGAQVPFDGVWRRRLALKAAAKGAAWAEAASCCTSAIAARNPSVGDVEDSIIRERRGAIEPAPRHQHASRRTGIITCQRYAARLRS